MTSSVSPVLVLVLNVLAVLCVVGAVAAFLISGRMALRWRQRHWSGDEVSGAESRRLNGRVRMLRIGAAISLAAAVILWIALHTLLAYQAA